MNRIKYHARDNNVKGPSPDIQSLTQYSIPVEIKHFRSLFVHYCMVWLEETLMRDQCALFQHQIDTLRVKLDRFIEYHRQRLSVRHRRNIWILRSRLTYVMFSLSDQNVGDFSTFKDLLRYRVLVSKNNPITGYSLALLWRSLMLLIARMNWIPFSRTLVDYVRALMLSCASFFMHPSANLSGRMNEPMFVRPSEDPIGGKPAYEINDIFIMETERIFYGIEKKLRFPLSVPRMSDGDVCDSRLVNNFKSWLNEFCETVYLEFIEDEFRTKIYNHHVYIAEYERYVCEEKYAADPTAYNIISKLRPEKIDVLSNWMDNASLDAIRTAIKNHSRFDDPGRIDLDYQLVCLTALGYWMLTKSNSISVWNYIYSEPFHNPNELWPPMLKRNYKVPVMVQVFNDYSVFYRKRCIHFDSIEACIIHWIRFICEDPKHMGIIPVKNNNCAENKGCDINELWTRIKGSKNDPVSSSHNQQNVNLPYFYQNGPGTT